ncbi:MAG: ABC transporter permease, partial [Prevotella sp.]|nr:ABC transporter permease [Prevotella sp.]
MIESTGDRIFKAVVTILLILLSLTCILPFINLLAISISDPAPVTMGRVGLYPIGFNITAYKTVFENGLLVRSLWFTIFLTIIYVAVTMVMTVLCAYPLARNDLRGRRPVTLVIMFTMYFHGGMIPTYLLVNNLRLVNTIWALILPGAINTFNMILMRTYFASL